MLNFFCVLILLNCAEIHNSYILTTSTHMYIFSQKKGMPIWWNGGVCWLCIYKYMSIHFVKLVRNVPLVVCRLCFRSERSKKIYK